MLLWLLWVQRDGQFSWEEQYLVVAAQSANEARRIAVEGTAFALEDLEIRAGPIEMPSAPGIICSTPWLVLD